MQDISLHILDIAENAIKARATRICIEITENMSRDILQVRIQDNGAGMDAELARSAADPFVTTRTERRVGLGIPLLAESARMAGGDLHIYSEPGKGTCIEASFGYSNIDRRPLGDIPATIAALVAGNPDVDFSYRHSTAGESFCVDTAELRQQLEGIPLNHPEVLRRLKSIISRGLQDLGAVLS